MFPTTSFPLRPALPHICLNSAVFKNLFVILLGFVSSVNTTVLVGILTPTANVSVANNTFIRPFRNNISIISFIIGITPE